MIRPIAQPVRTALLAAAVALTGTAAMAAPDLMRCSMERALGVEHGVHDFVTLMEMRGAQRAAATAFEVASAN
jgi:hypothetical protein